MKTPFWRTLRRFVAVLNAGSGGLFLALMPLALVLSVGEGLIASLLLPLFGALAPGDPSSVGGGPKLSSVRDMLGALGIAPELGSILTAFLVALVAYQALHLFYIVCREKLEQSFQTRLREGVYRALLDARWAGVKGRDSGGLMHVLTDEISQAGLLVFLLERIGLNLLLAAVYLGLSTWVSPRLTLIALGSAGVLGLAMIPSVRAALRDGRRVSERTGKLYTVLKDHLHEARIVRAYGLERVSLEGVRDLSIALERARVRESRNAATSHVIFHIGTAVALALVLVASRGISSVGTVELAVLVVVFARLTPVASTLFFDVVRFSARLVSFEWIEVTREGLAKLRAPARPTVRPLRLAEEIRFEDVGYRYEPGSGGPVLEGLSFTIEVGGTTAIVGPSGAGKTTLAELLLAILRPTSGRILVDGTDLAGIDPVAWRERIGFASHQSSLFSTTVRENLLLAQPGVEISGIWRALEMADARAFVEDLPESLDTPVGEGGARLSAGQAQRIGIARALLRGTRLLVLDEATSALDLDSERRILDAIASHSPSPTTVLISHRPSALRTADTVFALVGGSVRRLTSTQLRVLGEAEGLHVLH